MMPIPTSGRALPLAALLSLGLAAAAPLARAVETGPRRLSLTPALQQKLFPDLRRLSLQSTQERIAILQRHQKCLSTAGSMEALRNCERQERQALINQRQQRQQALRQMLERNGITPPAPRQNRDGGGQPPQPSGTPMI